MRCPAIFEISVPFTAMEPVCVLKMPTRVFAKVDLPAPLGPMMVVIVPTSQDREMLEMMTLRP